MESSDQHRASSVETLTIVARWYAKNLDRNAATARYRQYYERNHRRLTNRREGAEVATAAIEAVDKVWESLLVQALEAKA